MKKICQQEYMEYIAQKYFEKFNSQGYADAGNNGPHGHEDTPVRNTAHFLIIYSYMYKQYKDAKYLEICKKFADYICAESDKTKNGSVQCMVTDKFDHLNGLIGQGWAIEALLYYYGISNEYKYLDYACKIFYSQKYDYDLHLWHRIEIDGKDIGIDPTYNHNIWFAACSAKILNYKEDAELRKIIDDLMINGTKRDFRIYKTGLLRHSVKPAPKKSAMIRLKKAIKIILYPVRKLNLRKLDTKYMERAYHVFDMYGFCILEEMFPQYEIFSSIKYKKAKEYALDINRLNNDYDVFSAIKSNDGKFNVFSYSYNSLAFEFPYVSLCIGKKNISMYDELYNIQCQLMYDEKEKSFSRHNPDVITFDARTYEIIRYLEREEK